MKAIFKRELRSYFATPIGYVFCAVFLFAANLLFYLFNVLNRLTDLSMVFSLMLIIFMLTVPVLTMRLFAEEYRQKTDQLLLTAPVRAADIVLGKFFSAYGIVILVLCCTLVFPLIIALYGAPNGAAILGNYVAILCGSAACIAIGMFISALTESQILAMLGSWGLFLLLFLLYNFIPQNITWLRAIVNWFSPFNRFTSFTQGVFPLGDIVFYVSLTALFLFLSARMLEKKRWA